MSPSWPKAFSLVRRTLGVFFGLAAIGSIAAAGECKVSQYDIHVTLDPPAHGLKASATLRISREAQSAPAGGSDELTFTLNRSLALRGVTGNGVKVGEFGKASAASEPAGDSKDTPLLTKYRVKFAEAAAEFSLTFEYAGPLVQDVQAGERPGQIHNLMMAAHIGPEGIYLDGGGGWYPVIQNEKEGATGGELTHFRLTADPVDGMKLIAGADFDVKETESGGKLTWHSRYPVDSLALVGGAHTTKEKRFGSVHVTLHYTQPQDPAARETIEKNSDLFLKAAGDYLSRYEPLLGPFPFEQFAIVENFFSSGFAFPNFTLLNKTLWQMGPRALGHGYLDHEMLHAWWGNSVYVDPADGNWCEALTSYMANYYGYILDHDEVGARNQRRNTCVSLNALKPDEDKPLGTFSRPGGAGRDIGYGKGSMVFYMLAQQIGDDHFWAAMRKLIKDRTGKFADWKALQTCFEQESGRKLDRFFAEWVRQPGLPRLRAVAAKWLPNDHVLELTIEQEGTSFELAIPVRLQVEGGQEVSKTVTIDGPKAVVRLPLEQMPQSLRLDPDYQVLRRLEPREIMPTAKITAADAKLLIVTPTGELSPFYQRAIDMFRGEGTDRTITQRKADELKADELAGQSVLVLGDAVRSSVVAAFLKRTDSPIAWEQDGFRIGDADYKSPANAVLCTVHHPDTPGAAITLYAGNSESAIGRSDLLLFYRNSMVVFETSAKETDGKKAYESKVIARRDFEFQPVVKVVQ
ncbi:MAG: hypothetical protein HZB38_08750 [Planctomycetes bacterium]|nr:hypothetical protein [Planctomycetota bacterium]